MSALAWSTLAAGAAIAAFTAGADGALASPECRDVPGAEPSHRALGIVRVAAYLLVGAGAVRCTRAWGGGARGTAAAFVVGVIALVVLADVALRAAASRNGPRGARVLRPLLRALTAALAPLLRVGTTLEGVLERFLPVRSDHEAEREAEAEQFREVIEAEAEVSGPEAALLHRAFDLSATEVRDVMVPRVDIIGVDGGAPWSEVVDRVRSSGHSRLPVFHGTIDDVVGVLYAKDLLGPVLHGEEPAAGWASLVRPATFIPQSKPVDRQLREFRSSGTHIAIVSDEFGGTAGLVTIEDVLEEIVGEIRDERDQEEPDVVREGDARFWVAGRLSLGELSDLLGHSFEREDVATVGGLVYDVFKRVPRAGDELQLEGFRIVVERVRRRRVERVYFERLVPAHAAEEP
ncbi:MAG TPA: hemolysin family protein [Gemmatimonadaceae bacterium]|nr:hemolysin family protein [Gemmatimonadaceae bacterium]